MNRDQQRAVGLVELLVAVVLLSILISMAIPAFARFQESKRQETTRDLLASHIQQTRTSAVLSGRPHELCGSSDGETCDGSWDRYWLITALGDPPDMIQQHPAPSQKLCWKGFARDTLRFQPNGTSPSSNGSFSICASDGPAWQLILNRQGRLRKARGHHSITCC
ncbi:GspH/FimT family pseudopilin [Pseudomonas sp. Bi70]|uniref:GspH/FimT family pseudopilin n=1 Tax=Pseudomonas sp. Bi70 TaxID=2821127 RepID=UPI001E4369E2|nr:GspH/FimT family pseudopilin [Pseudomonas sp. Bi70]